MSFAVGQRVIAKANKILYGYYGHVEYIDDSELTFVGVRIAGRTGDSCDRNAKEIGGTFPFYPFELEAAD